MNNILEYGNLIKRIRDGENLPEIAHYALDCLYKDGPIDTVVLEILSYMKIFQPGYFKTIEDDVIEIMGLFFKSPTPETLQGVVFDIYAQHIRELWGDNYTPMQADILKQIDTKQCFSFSAPTSTGKSFVFRNIILKSEKDIVTNVQVSLGDGKKSKNEGLLPVIFKGKMKDTESGSEMTGKFTFGF